MKTWTVTLRRDSLLGSPLEIKVSAHLSCTNAGVLEFWLVNDSALLPSLTLLRAIPPGWMDVQLVVQSADSKDIEAMLANDTRRTKLHAAGGTTWVPDPEEANDE